MSRSKQPSSEISCIEPVQSEPTEDSHPYGDQVCVLAGTDEEEIFESKPTVLLCPNCGEKVAAYNEGLPQVVPQFNTCCTKCQVELRRWCVVTVDASYNTVVEPPALVKMTQAYWDEWLWGGITNYKGQPRNDEYTNRLSMKASEFGWDWELRCPLCRRGISQFQREVSDIYDSLDYHHWSTEPDQGITLCRECHDAIGFNSYDNEVEKRAHEWGFRSRNDLQIIRLALREAIATARPLQPEMASKLVNRYNLIQSTGVVKELLKTVLRDSEMYDRFVDDSLYQGIPNS